MNKTLLIAAAALAAGVISSQAQVYSQNVVGYVNQPIPAGGYQIVASQLINGSDANKTNGDVNVLFSGLVSSPVPVTVGNPGQDPALSSNTVVYAWFGGSLHTYYYFNSADIITWNGSGSAGFYDSIGTPLALSLPPGNAVFLKNNFSQPITVTTVGTVFQGTNVATIASGYNLISFEAPIADAPNASNYGLPLNLTSSPNDPPTLTQNDTIFVWYNNSLTTFYYFNSADATSWQNSGGSTPVFPAGFYDSIGGAMPTGAFPQVNQGFYLYHNGAPISWTNSFTVQ